MFDHSIKVPRLYKIASKIAKQVSEGKGSIKQLVYENKKHPNIKALYALLVHTFQKTDDIENIFKKSKLLAKEPRLDPWLAKILTTELLWGKKCLPGQSKPIKTILAYEQIFKAHLSDVSSNDFAELTQVYKPRYVRVNTLKTTVNEAVEDFINEGWILKRYRNTGDYLDFLDTVSNLGPEEFMIDLHIPYLLIFPQKTQFYKHRLYKNGSIILQDKASCLPVHILNPEPGSVVLDMCAAPGMKTTQCATIMKNSGIVYAVEIGKKRYETLQQIVETAGATCVETINADVLSLPVERYKNVEYILVDPSCSGSGITDRVEIGQQEIDQHKDRLDKLAGFQIKVLRHALFKFPKVKRVVYSTCSVYPEENEDVVRQVLETCFYFKLVPADRYVENKWRNFGSSDFGNLGNYCLYAKPDIDLTSGFFVAVFERLEEGDRNPFLNENLFLRKMQKRRQKERKEEYEEIGETAEVDVQSSDRPGIGEISQKDLDVSKKKIKNENSSVENYEIKSEDKGFEIINTRDEAHIFKKKKKKRDDESLTENLIDTKHAEDKSDIKEEIDHLSENVVHKKKKKKTIDENLKVASDDEQKVLTMDEDTVHKKKKKKHKEDTQIDCIEEPDDSLQTYDGENGERKKKKKRREDEKIDDTQEPVDNLQTCDSGNDQPKKKKKHRKNERIDNIVEPVDSIRTCDSGSDEPSQKKKMKKKKKHEDLSGSNETEYAIVEGNDEIIAEHKIKKEKKKELKLGEDTLKVEEVEKSKKRKRRENSESIEIPSPYDDQVSEKQPKKKKIK